MRAIRIAAIGYGAMTRALEAALVKGDHGLRLDAVLVRNAAPDTAATIYSSVDALIGARPQLVVECASHTAVRDTVPLLLAAGIDVVIASIGALADDALVVRLEEAARQGGARLTAASGAIGGLDALRSARLAGLTSVVYEGRKPPAAWRGTPAEAYVDLGSLKRETVIFDGTARESAALYPKNANVTAAVALAGVGFDDTKVRLIADPASSGNSHALTAEGAFGRFTITLNNTALPSNPKTSWLAALSIEQEALRHFRRLDL
ncbi:MAG: aspartate dehydrogenase [Hyphomicrobiales bacterium]